MHILILGATGSIGTAVAAELHRNGHQITALARSDQTAQILAANGYTPLKGNITDPTPWIDIATKADAVIHLAATFDDAMADIDHHLMSAFALNAAQRDTPLRFIYTGGCWLYGVTGDHIATEDTPFDPIKAFAWSLDIERFILAQASFSAAVIHPAMVYHEHGGVFSRFIEQAALNQPIEVWGAADTRWPLIHRDDLAVAYRKLIEDDTLTGHFNASAQTGVPVQEIVASIANHFANTQTPVIRNVTDLIAEHGAWAEGPTLDQQMSGAKLNTAIDWRPKITDFSTADWKRPI